MMILQLKKADEDDVGRTGAEVAGELVLPIDFYCFPTVFRRIWVYFTQVG